MQQGRSRTPVTPVTGRVVFACSSDTASEPACLTHRPAGLIPLTLLLALWCLSGRHSKSMAITRSCIVFTHPIK
jgi:hypothetical protein